MKKLDCETCGLASGCKSPNMPVGGYGRKKHLYITEAPGKIEDQYNTQLIGDAGTLFELILKDETGIMLNRDGFKYHAVNCRPPKNRTPKTKEINCCRQKVFDVIQQTQPEKIFLLGATAIRSVYGHRTSDIGRIAKWVGKKIPDQLLKTWVFPTYHPRYLLKMKEQRKQITLALEWQIRKHLREAVQWNEPFPDYSNDEKEINIITDRLNVLSFLRSVSGNYNKLFFDYETTGLKPHINGHKIVCASMAFNDKQVYSFPIFYDQEFIKAMEVILTDPTIAKGAHNLPFEDVWTKIIFGFKVRGWFFDSMQAAHVIDNTPETTGLKFQSISNFGIVGYDNDIKKYLKAKEKYGNAFNKIMEIWNKDPIKVLTYCGMDSKLEYRLYEKQEKKLDEMKLRDGFNFMMDGIYELCKIEQNGIPIDKSHYEKHMINLDRKLIKLNKVMHEMDEAKLFKEKENKEININSDKQLIKLFYNHLKYKPTKFTDKGNISIDESVLSNIGISFTDHLLEYKKYYKTKNTYLSGIYNEAVYEPSLGIFVMHPFFNLHIARTFRSSSSMFNFQNIPIRNEELQYLCRAGIKAFIDALSKVGYYIVEKDYKGIEVRVSACYNKDKVLLADIMDSRNDMHRDEAASLLFLSRDEVPDRIRKAIKNQWVFPQFYGSYHKQCGPDIWYNTVLKEKLNDGTPLIIHLRQQGITCYEEFEEHVKNCEDIFWNQKFIQYKRWKDKIWNFYLQNGYIESYTGFRYSGLMKKKEVTNYQIQGSAFHCLLWSLIQINRYMIKNRMKSRIIGQIHDSMVMLVIPEEIDEVNTICTQIMTKDIRKHWPWIITPLAVETEISELNGDWAHMHKIEV